MFGTQFYPTPDNLIDRMIKPYIKDIRTYYGKEYLDARSILEPQAGKGDVVEM